MKIVSVIGARPQFIKCATVSREIRQDHTEILVHTGQHYDPELSDIFFEELCIPKPDYNLGVGSGSHGSQTGEILIKIENVLKKESPNFVIVYGDTNSTLAGALAAAKLHIPIAHVEAGLRSFDRKMPEEINRIMTDHLSNLLFCPTETAVKYLASEGITSGVHNVGDVMADALAFNRAIAMQRSNILEREDIKPKEYYVLTIHRPSNTDDKNTMNIILSVLGEIGIPVIFPIHPRTKKYLELYGLFDILPKNIQLIKPLGYLDMIRLMASARKILTDSGGMQKEAYILEVPCITLRENTEWIETLTDNWNILTGINGERIKTAVQKSNPKKPQHDLYPLGASEKIRILLNKVSEEIY